MALTKYEGRGEVYYQGRLLVEIKSARVALASNDNEVTTMAKGFAGFSDGPERAQVDLDTAVPKAGYEADYWAAITGMLDVVLVIVSGGERRAIEGRFISLDETKSDTAAAASSVNFVGKPIGSL